MFRGKDDGVRVQGILTSTGGAKFETARARLAALFRSTVGRDPGPVSDADVIEYLARGEQGTAYYLKAHHAP